MIMMMMMLMTTTTTTTADGTKMRKVAEQIEILGIRILDNLVN